ncbi:MAG: enoyl-CoA hydratase-related protein [Oscillochloridaceae bacterium umkhey_bin13]
MTREPTVLYAADAGIATLTMHRPEVYNALSLELHTDLIAALERAEADPAVRCLVLTGGTGKAFSSGQDLREFPLEGAPAMIGERLRANYNPLVQKLMTMPKPIIAALNGVAAGAGFSIALACDLRIAATSARLVVAFIRIGLIPDCGMLYTLPRLVGQARAFELAARGADLDAATALNLGLLNLVVPDEELPAAARALASELAHRPAYALGLLKQTMHASAGASLVATLEYEAQAQQQAGAHPDFAEGVQAFREKRPARFG